MSHTLINCTCKNLLGCSLLPFTLIPQYFKKFNKIKNTLKQTKFEENTVKSTQLSLVLVGLHDFQIFPDRKAHAWSQERSFSLGEAWKWETYVRSQSFSSESTVKYLYVRRRKIQISPPQGEQDQSNALFQGQQRHSNPYPMPCAPPPHPSPRGHNIDRCITLKWKLLTQNTVQEEL